MRSLKLIARLSVAAVAFAALVSENSIAAENGIGVYLLGFRGPQAGIAPPPGVYLQNDVYYYSGSASASRELPFNGQLIAGVKATVKVDLPTLIWSTPVQIAGGNLVFSATLPIGGPKVDADASLSILNTVIARNLTDSVTTVGDPFLSSFVAWHSGNFHWNTGVSANVPIGDYQQGQLANMAFHRWAGDFFAAGTWLDQRTGHELSGAVGLTVNGKNPATDYKTGTEFHVEFAAIQHFSKQFNLGAVGYFYEQLTGDSGTGARLGPFKGRVAALGGTLGYTFMAGQLPIMTRIKVFREFDVENRLEGTAAFFTVAIPLSVSSSPTSSGKPMFTKASLSR